MGQKKQMTTGQAPTKKSGVVAWALRQTASGMLFVLGIALMFAWAYAFQTLTNDPNSAGFTSNGAPMLTRSGGVFDRETMSLQAISDYVTAVTLISPVNGSQLAYNGGGNATSATLSWGTVPKATSYSVFVGTSQATMAKALSGTTALSTTVSSLTKNTAYYWQVVANMPGSTSKASSIWVFTTNCPSTETLEGGSCIGTKSIACSAPGGVSNYTFFNSTTNYNATASWNGSNWVNPSTSYAATPLSGSCQYNCASGYGWNGSNCVASPQTLSACNAPASVSNYVFYNGTTTYTPQSSWNGSTWSLGNSSSVGTTPTTPGTPASPTINTCQWQCATNFAWNGSNCEASPKTLTCAAPSGISNYIFSNGSNAYSYTSAGSRTANSWANGYTVAATAGTPTTTPAANTCQWKCNAGAYAYWNGSNCVPLRNSLASDTSGWSSLGWACPTCTYSTYGRNLWAMTLLQCEVEAAKHHATMFYPDSYQHPASGTNSWRWRVHGSYGIYSPNHSTHYETPASSSFACSLVKQISPNVSSNDGSGYSTNLINENAPWATGTANGYTYWIFRSSSTSWAYQCSMFLRVNGLNVYGKWTQSMLSGPTWTMSNGFQGLCSHGNCWDTYGYISGPTQSNVYWDSTSAVNDGYCYGYTIKW